jgi:hypothetical protein
MIAHRFGQIKECTCGVEKNRSDHFSANVQRDNLPPQRCEAARAQHQHPGRENASLFLFGKVRSHRVA